MDSRHQELIHEVQRLACTINDYEWFIRQSGLHVGYWDERNKYVISKGGQVYGGGYATALEAIVAARNYQLQHGENCFDVHHSW